MQARVQFKGQPIHPLLAAFPFALLTTAAGVDVFGRKQRQPPADLMIEVGLLMGIAAALTGLADAGAEGRGGPARRAAPRQALLAGGMLAIGMATLWTRRRRGSLTLGTRALSAAAAAFACAAAWSGNRLVYRYHVGVAAPNERVALPTA